ncbi:uncharacterized protein LOC141660315 [Apium graveolens]|uniref:uncharacterized protein LOC141660315 n=1 Tax=Apium graveolens TaxID=4045 RepID=UPI003D790962
MAPTTPTVSQRIEELEDVMGNLDVKVTDLVSQSVEKAVGVMKQSLVELLLQGQKDNSKKYMEELETVTTRLEGRISRSREHQEALIFSMKNEQDHFLSEVKSSLISFTNLQTLNSQQMDKPEGSVNRAESAVRMTPLTPNNGVSMGYVVGSPLGDRSQYGGGGSGGGPDNWRFRKLDMALFDGSDPDGWIMRVERYFNFYRLSEEERLEAVVVALEGDALHWFQWEPKRFIETAAPLDKVPETILLGQFLNGLKDEVKAEVRMLNLMSLEQAMELAFWVEEKNQVSVAKKSGASVYKSGSYSVSFKGLTPRGSATYSCQPSPTPIRSWTTQDGESQSSVSSPKYLGAQGTMKTGGEMRRLTDRELQEKRAKGLCFKCDEKWMMGHRCKKRELSVLLIDEDDEDGTEFGGNETPSASNEERPTERKRGDRHDRPRSNTQFISISKVEELGVPIADYGGFGVALGNGDSICGKGLCRGVSLQLEGTVEVRDDFLPLELGNSDVILGVQWLETLGNVVSNWKTQVMQYEADGKTVTLVGDPALVHSEISLKAMLKTILEERGGICLELKQVQQTDKFATNSPTGNEQYGGKPAVAKYLTTTLEQYASVFATPVGLPPVRGHEHAIVLKEGSNLVGFVLVFFDDILVYSSFEEEHKQHVQLVLATLEKHSLVVNRKKCSFGVERVAYLGHVISGQRVAIDMDKVKSILDWPYPRNLKELRGFLGLTRYYHKYVRHYAQIAQPLTEQLKKYSFGWTSVAMTAFDALKQAMVSPPVLALPNFTKQFILETDASGFGVGVVLMQDNKPIAFFSKLLGPRAQQKSVYEKELMAICLAVQKWHFYILGRHFLYKSGCSNRVVDALSRKGVGDVELGSLLTEMTIDWTTLDKEVQHDPLLQQIKQELLTNKKEHVGFSVHNDQLLYKGRSVIPRSSTFVSTLLHMYHNSPIDGHSGDVKTYLKLAADWF